MDQTTVHAILLQYGKWAESATLLKLVKQKMDVRDRQTYVLIKKARESKNDRLHIQKQIFSDRKVWYGLPEFGPPTLRIDIGRRKTKQHSRIAVKRVKPYLEHPYHLLMSYDSGDFDKLFPEFAGHLKTGYPDLYILFQNFKDLPRNMKVSIIGEREEQNEPEIYVEKRTEEVEGTEDPMERIVHQVYDTLRNIILVVENGGMLKGSCDFCPDRIPREE